MRTRVLEVQRHTAWALVATGLFTLAAVVTALVPHRTGTWLPLHLFLVGGLLCAISGVTQMLSVTWSTAPAPTDAVAAAQLALVVLGAVSVAVGREVDAWALVALGAVLLGAGLVVLAGTLWWVRRWSGTDRFRPAIGGYTTAVAWGLAGIVLGATAARGGEFHTLRLVEAHLMVNVWGLVGLVILATLPFFMATQLRMKMSPSANAARERMVVLSVSAAVALVVAGELTDVRPLVAAGNGVVALAVAATAAILPRPTRKQFDWAGPRLVGLVAGLVWWFVSAVMLARVALDRTVLHSDALLVLVVGAYGQILAASVAYLAPVLRGGGHQRLGPGLRLMKSWPGVAAANLAALMLLFGLRRVAVVVIAAWVLDTAVRVVVLLRPPNGAPAQLR